MFFACIFVVFTVNFLKVIGSGNISSFQVKRKKMVCGSSSQRMLGVCFRRPEFLLLVGYLTTAPQKVKGGSPKLSVSLRN